MGWEIRVLRIELSGRELIVWMYFIVDKTNVPVYEQRFLRPAR